MKNVTQYKTPPLPDTKEDLLRNRRIKTEVKLHDRIEPLVIELWATDAEFKKLMLAVNNGNSVNGTCELDHIVATLRVQEFAKVDSRDPVVAEEQLVKAKKSLTIVRNRLGIGLKQRRAEGMTMVADESDATTAA